MSGKNRLTQAKYISVAVVVGFASLVAVPALAQAVLNASQISAIQSTLKSALLAAKDNATALEAAISNNEQSSTALYGAGTVSSVTSIVITTSEQAKVNACSIGSGLAMAATSIAAKNLTDANSIAATIANEGKEEERSCFQKVALEHGYANLASVAGGNPAVTGGIPVTGGTNGGLGAAGLGANTAGANAGCLNPSCTKL